MEQLSYLAQAHLFPSSRWPWEKYASFVWVVLLSRAPHPHGVLGAHLVFLTTPNGGLDVFQIIIRRDYMHRIKTPHWIYDGWASWYLGHH